MSVTNFHTNFSKGNNTAIIHINMSQFGWGPFFGLNARGPLRTVCAVVSGNKSFEWT